MMLLHFLLLAAANAAASDKDREPVPYEMDRDFHTKLFSVTVDEHHYDHGVVVPPAVKGDWDVTLDLVPDADARQIRADYPLVDELWDGCRAIVEPFEPEEINGAKVYGDSAIYMAFSIKERAVTQFYTGQKRLFLMWATPYVGTISNDLVIEPLFDSEAELFKFNCGIVSWEDANMVEALAYQASMRTLGKRRRHLCMQMPIGWVARFGLHPRQIAFIEAKEDGHPLKDVLIKKDGGKIGWYPPPVAGKMDPERADYHTYITNAGVLEHGHELWRFKPGNTYGFRFKPGNTYGFKPGNTLGVLFKPGKSNYNYAVAAMPHIYAPTYMLIANIAFGCAHFSRSKDRDDCIPQWLSESGVVTAHILRQPQFKKPFEFDLEGESYRIVGANARMTLPLHNRVNEERYVFDAVRGDEWDESYILPANFVCVGLGLLDDDEVPPSSPYRSAYHMFQSSKAFKPWPRGFTRKGRFAPIEPGTEFVDDDKPHGKRWVIFREGVVRVSAPEPKQPHKTRAVPVVYYCKPGSNPTERNYKAEDGPCEYSTLDEVLLWMQQTQEGLQVEARPKKRRRGSDDSAGPGKVVAGGIFLTLAAARLRAELAGRGEGDDDEEARAHAA